MKLIELKPKQIVIHKWELCSVLAVVRGPFMSPNGEPELASFVKLCPIKPFTPDRFVRVRSDAEYKGQPYIRDVRNKFCTALSFDQGWEAAEISTLDITIE